jgi:hypothetical protein
MAALTTLAFNLVKGGKGISVKQQEDRLANCFDNCIFHKSPSLFRFSEAASWLIEKATDFVTVHDLEQTKYERKGATIGSCAMCGGCKLKEKVKMSAPAVFAGLAPEALDRILAVYGDDAFKRCWQLREAAQDPKLREKMLVKLRYTNNNGEQHFKTYEEKLKNGDS